LSANFPGGALDAGEQARLLQVRLRGVLRDQVQHNLVGARVAVLLHAPSDLLHAAPGDQRVEQSVGAGGLDVLLAPAQES